MSIEIVRAKWPKRSSRSPFLSLAFLRNRADRLGFMSSPPTICGVRGNIKNAAVPFVFAKINEGTNTTGLDVVRQVWSVYSSRLFWRSNAMQVEDLGDVCEWAQLTPGQAFLWMRRPISWCIRASLADRPDCAIVFSREAGRRNNPWIHVGPIIDNPIIRFAEARIRVDWTNAIACGRADVPLGAIWSVGGRYDILASAGSGQEFCFDITNGVARNALSGHEGCSIGPGHAVLYATRSTRSFSSFKPKHSN
jgi:hypothetical protein